MKLAASLLAALLVFAFSHRPLLAQDGPTVAEGRALLQRKDFNGAVRVLQAITEREPDNARAWAALGSAHHALKDYEAAIAAYEEATDLDATLTNVFYNLACVHSRQQDAPAALECLAQAVTAGFDNRAQAFTDPDLAFVRSDTGFSAALPPLFDGADAFVEKPRVLHEWRGEAANDQFGWVARRVGDLDGDGVRDFVTSAPTKVVAGKPACGRIYVYSSRSGELLFSDDGKPGERFGNGVAICGDVDADGTQDFVIGAPGSGAVPGNAYVYSGADFSRLHSFRGHSAADQFGLKVAGVQDLDGDGHDEVLVGAPQDDSAGRDAGRVFVYGGGTGELLFHLDGESAGDRFGSALDGTLTDDQFQIAVGAMQAGRTGRGYVFQVEDGQPSLLFTIDPDATSRNLGQYFITFCGDVDADGFADVFCSDWNNAARGPSTGRVFVHSGFDGERLLTITGHVAGEGFGTSISNTDDVDGDGHADLVIGAWQHAGAARSGGKVYLHSGADSSLMDAWTCRQAGDTLGFDAQGIGDVDGDGCVDFLLTSGWSEVHGPQTGRVFIVAGTVKYGGE